MTQGQRLRAIMADHDCGPEYALVECIECPARARIDGTYGRSTDSLRVEFEGIGWLIGPTLCPEHAAAGRAAGIDFNTLTKEATDE